MLLWEIPHLLHLEGMTLRDADIEGGSGHAAATLKDQGFEPTNGAVGFSETIVKKKRTRKSKKEVCGTTLGLADIETDPMCYRRIDEYV